MGRKVRFSCLFGGFLWRSSLAATPPRESKRLSATDTCAEVSHALDPILDEADPIDQSYYLEVGSPGLGRKLTRPEHYEALKGEKIGVKLIRPTADGVREFAGILKGREGSTVTVETENGPVSFEVNAASGVHLCDDEHLFD